MRLWYWKILPYIPTSQLSAQWRELNSIFKKQDNHILINYIYEYDKQTLYNYTQFVIEERKKRRHKVLDWTNYNNYFSDSDYKVTDSMFNEHNDEVADFEYLQECFTNLREKFRRGQKDFSKDRFNQLYKFYKEEEKKFLTKYPKYDIINLVTKV